MISFKVFSALIVLVACIAGGILASKLSKSKSNLASLANTFAGGVFFGAAMLHMLPDAVENFKLFEASAE